MKITAFKNIFQQNKRNEKNDDVSFGTRIKGFPGNIEVGISKNCNLRCSYCPNTFIKQKLPDEVMPMSLFEKVLKDLKEIDFDGVFCFHRFNEPLLANVEKYIIKAKEILPKIKPILYTNGTGLTRERLESLQKTPLDRIVVTQQEQTKIGFIDKLREIPDRLLKNVSVRYSEDILLINRAGVMKQLGEPLKEPCYSIHASFAVDSDGKVPLCIDDYYGKVILGDVHNETIEEIWNKPSSQELRKILEEGRRKDIDLCKDCDRTLDKRILSADLSKNEALYRKELLERTGSAHIK